MKIVYHRQQQKKSDKNFPYTIAFSVLPDV